MISKEQEERRFIRVSKTLSIFLDNDGNISDREISEALAMCGIESSSSSVGRDLTVSLEKYLKLGLFDFLFDDEDFNKLIGEEKQSKYENFMDFISNKRKTNKHAGQVKGGLKSVFNNEIVRDEKGAFNGCVPRK